MTFLISFEVGEYSSRVQVPIALVQSTKAAAGEVAVSFGVWLDSVLRVYGDPDSYLERADQTQRQPVRLDPERYGWDAKNLPQPPGVTSFPWEDVEHYSFTEVRWPIREVPVLPGPVAPFAPPEEGA